MNGWKLATYCLAALLCVTLIVSYVITCEAIRSANAANGTAKTIRPDFERAKEAASDAQAFINFFRMNDDLEFSKEDYQHHVRILTNKYIHYYPEWASSLSDKKDSAMEPKAGNGG